MKVNKISGQAMAADLLQDFLQTKKQPESILPLNLQYFAEATMHARNAIHGAQGVAYVTIEGNRYKFAQLINLEARMDKTKTKVPIMGKTGKGNKSTGWEGTGSATFHFNTSIFRKLLKRYKETGEDIYFDIQVTNEDGSSTVGRQTTILIDCNMDGGIIAALDADAEYLEDSVDFTFEDWDMPEEFETLQEML
ncbi:phage tail tube protein [Lysinibacillus capsici]|uniref:phage tail tube protein n=1 Tax=Lysinibacillus capsici TaxID=2115968 RepID=UPI0028BE8C1A|nr:phage tail tube protein [Lysinibacillus capsici]WNN77773.1 phage tail tube protein [Lysinibacillus capsici]